MDQTQKEILGLINSNKNITKREISEKTKLSNSNIQRVLDELRDLDIIERTGTNRTGSWQIKSDEIIFNDALLDQTWTKLGPNLDQTEKEIITLINSKSNITKNELALKLELSPSKVQRYLTNLKNREIIDREGSSRKGKWIVKRT